MNNPMLDFLRSDGSVVVNKRLIHSIGLNEALLYSELISKHFYFENRGQIEEGYFFNTADNLLADTGLTAKQQRVAIDNLVKLNLIETKIKGIPARKYFKINQDLTVLIKIMATDKKNQQLGKKVTTGIAHLSQLVEQKGQCNNTNIKIIKNNNKDYITLSQSDGEYVSFYLSVHDEIISKPHKRVTAENYDKIMDYIKDVKSCVDYDEWRNGVIDYFNELPNGNDGDINSFMLSSYRYIGYNLQIAY